MSHHSDTTRKSYKYLVGNPPGNLDSLDKLLVEFTSKQVRIRQINYIMFLENNSSTSYFVDNPDDPGGWSSEELVDYYGGARKPESGLGIFYRTVCEKDSTKFIYMYSNKLKGYSVPEIVLRDEYTSNWYENNKHNELVRIFNENMCF